MNSAVFIVIISPFIHLKMNALIRSYTVIISKVGTSFEWMDKWWVKMEILMSLRTKNETSNWRFLWKTI